MCRIQWRKSCLFSGFRGARQSDNVYLVLFALFLNDLETFLFESCNGVNFEFQNDCCIVFLRKNKRILGEHDKRGQETF